MYLQADMKQNIGTLSSHPFGQSRSAFTELPSWERTHPDRADESALLLAQMSALMLAQMNSSPSVSCHLRSATAVPSPSTCHRCSHRAHECFVPAAIASWDLASAPAELPIPAIAASWPPATSPACPLHAPPVSDPAPVAAESGELAEAPPRKDMTEVWNIRRADVSKAWKLAQTEERRLEMLARFVATAPP